jgi:putative intracellular protease/amidase
MSSTVTSESNSKIHSTSNPLYKTWKFWIVGITAIVLSFGGAFYGLISLIDKSSSSGDLAKTTTKDLAYLSMPAASRGKILAVVTSTDKLGNTDKSTGYELTELARAYYVFEANGYEVDIASPLGGNPPVVIDNDDMGPFDYAFLNDVKAQSKVNNTLELTDIDAQTYSAIYFVGGKGTMFDFPDNEDIHSIVKDVYENNGVIGAVCHGPAALLNVQLSNGRHLLDNRTVSALTNSEELFLTPEAKSLFPFLLETELIEAGAIVNKTYDYMEKISVDGRLVTGQNPWSVWKTAEAMLVQLGVEPKIRNVTDEENSIRLLMTFKDRGFNDTEHLLQEMIQQERPIKRNLVLMHAIVAAMKAEFVSAISLLRITHKIKSYQEEAK